MSSRHPGYQRLGDKTRGDRKSHRAYAGHEPSGRAHRHDRAPGCAPNIQICGWSRLGAHTQAGARSEASRVASCQVSVGQPGHASARVTARLSGPVLLA
jgi:hypothetical protein